MQMTLGTGDVEYIDTKDPVEAEYVEMLRDLSQSYAACQDETAREYAANVKSAGTLLLGIVNDIIDHSQMQLNKMEIIDNEYNTADLFRECINVVSVLAKEKNLELFINIDENIPKILKGDKKRIQQILINLLTNAVKYTKKGSVSFYAKIDSMEETEVSLSFGVEDTGIGIKKEELENLNPDDLSPREALEELYKLKEMLKC